MPDAVAASLVKRLGALKSNRGNWEQHWQEIAELISPMRAEFNVTRQPGEKRMQKVYDSAPGMAAENLSAGLYGLMTSPANVWFRIQSSTAEINDVHDVKVWCDQVSWLMLSAFSANGNRFYTRAIDLYADSVTFGTGIFYVEEKLAGGRSSTSYSCRHLAECYIAQNDDEEVDTVFRSFRYTARQAKQKWGDKLSAGVLKAADKEPEREFDFLHAVMPANDFEAHGGKPPNSGRTYASCYVDIEGQGCVGNGGYFEFPYMVPRWSTRSRSVYGDSPGQLALPDSKMLNAMSKTVLVGAQKVVDPPLLVPDEMAVRGLKTSPGQLLYGGVDPTTGRALYQPLVTGAKVELGLEMQEQRRQAIREAFYYSLLIMIQQPNMTATEFLGRQEEKLRLMGPHLGRNQAEFLDPLIARQFAIMLRAGAFPPMPAVMQQSPGLKIEYISPLARAQKASEAGSLLRVAEGITPIAAANPDIWDNFDTDEWARTIADGFGAPAKILRDRDDVDAIRQRRAQKAAAATAITAAPEMAGGVKDLAQAAVASRQARQIATAATPGTTIAAAAPGGGGGQQAA